MIGNLIVWLIFMGLVVLFGWLVVRAWKAKRWFIKWPGLLLSGIFTLLFAAIVVISAIGLTTLYLPTSEPSPDLKVEGSSEQVARGQYLVNIGCVGCHGANQGLPLTGGFDLADEIPIPLGSIKAVNLTPGGILNDRTDGELFRAIRHGYGKDGRLLVMMSSISYRKLSDDDIKAVIAFLRTQTAAEGTPDGGDHMNILGAMLFGSGMFPSPEPINKTAIVAPARSETAEYGQYVATIGECRGCHGSDMTGTPPSSLDPVGIPNPRPIVQTWSREQFVQAMRSGVRPSGVKFAETMPWQSAAQMDDQDLAALYAYLVSQP